METVKTFNNAEVQRRSLETYLREALSSTAPALPVDAQTVLGGLAETVTLLPMVFMALLCRALVRAKAKPEEVQVIDGVSGTGPVLFVNVGETQLAQVRFVVDHTDGFTMDARLQLTPEAVALIDAV